MFKGLVFKFQNLFEIMVITLIFLRVRCYRNYKNYVGYGIGIIWMKDYHYFWH
jgi:hypothetical protein